MKSIKLNRNLKKQLGQGMTEYIIIVGVIAIAAIGVFGLFGQTVENQVAGLARELGGQSGANALQNADTSSLAAENAANAATNDLSNYDQNGQ